ADHLLDLVREPALHGGLDFDPEVVANPIAYSGSKVRDPVPRARRDVLHEDSKRAEGGERSFREGECTLHRGPDTVERGLHALMEESDRSREGGAEEIQRALDDLLQPIGQLVDDSLRGGNAVLDCFSESSAQRGQADEHAVADCHKEAAGSANRADDRLASALHDGRRQLLRRLDRAAARWFGRFEDGWAARFALVDRRWACCPVAA